MEEPMKKTYNVSCGENYRQMFTCVQPDETALAAILALAQTVSCVIFFLSEMAVICLWETRESVVW